MKQFTDGNKYKMAGYKKSYIFTSDLTVRIPEPLKLEEAI